MAPVAQLSEEIRRHLLREGKRCAPSAGLGFLLDASDSDRYIAGGNGTNGGGEGGTGFLLDAGAHDDSYTAGAGSTNGGSDFAGLGFLLDEGGTDTYTGGDTSANGAGPTGNISFSEAPSVGLLVDGGATALTQDRSR